jgi:hypothetical protein
MLATTQQLFSDRLTPRVFHSRDVLRKRTEQEIDE